MPSHHDYGVDCEHFCGGTPDDVQHICDKCAYGEHGMCWGQGCDCWCKNRPCPSCGSKKCVNFACEDEGDLRFDIPPREQGPFLCTICHKNGVDALNGFDTCAECLARQ